MPTYPALQAGQIMIKALICVGPQQCLRELELLLIEHRIGGVPVVDEGRLVGVVSRSDIARVQVLMNSLDGQVTDELRWDDQADGFQHNERAEFQGFRQILDRLKVKDAMHDQVVTCTPATLVAEVAESMVRQHTHRVIVVEGDRPVGIISSLDLVSLLVQPASDSTRK